MTASAGDAADTTLLDQFRLSGCTAVVTGVGPGIGEHVARGYAALGANVVLCARTRPKVEAAAETIRAEGGEATAVAADVGEAADLDRLVEVAHETYGPVDILFNNAAATTSVGGDDGLALPDDDWQDCFAVNLLAPVRLARAVVPDMRARGRGSIVNVLTTAAFTPVADVSAWAYGATKAGLWMLTRYLAKECGPEVRANAICPGTIAADDDAQPMVGWDDLRAHIPLQRFGLAREVVAAAAFLASPASSYVTGQVLFVDGGRVSGAT